MPRQLRRDDHQGEQQGLDTSGGVSAFERIKHEDEAGEYWLARELMLLLGYDEWQNFITVVHEAMEVCRVQGGTTAGQCLNG